MRLYFTWCASCGTGINTTLKDQRDDAAQRHMLETALKISQKGPKSIEKPHNVYSFEVEIDRPTELAELAHKGK
jgi:hypothetical protein